MSERTRPVSFWLPRALVMWAGFSAFVAIMVFQPITGRWGVFLGLQAFVVCYGAFGFSFWQIVNGKRPTPIPPKEEA
jgi:hypothetical protein